MAETTSKATAAGEDLDESAKYFDFPEIVKEGSEFKVNKSDDYTKIEEIMYRDIKPSEGDGIKEKQKVSLHYNCYNRSAALIESMNFEGSLDELPKKFGPGLKKGIEGMKLHGKRRIIILPSKTDTQGKKAGESSTGELKVSKAGKEVESRAKSADTQVEKGEVSKVELPVVFDVELLGIRRTWNPFG